MRAAESKARLPVTRSGVLLVGLTCLVASASFGGAVTAVGLLAGVLPSVGVVAAITGALVLRSRVVTGLVVGVGTGLLLAQAANILSGTANGPVARSTAAATALAAAALVLLRLVGAPLFLLPVAAIVAVALYLGAAGEVGLPAIGTVLLAVVAVALVQAGRQGWTGRPPGRVAVPVAAVLVTLLAAGVVLAQQVTNTDPPGLAAEGQLDPTIDAGGLLVLPAPLTGGKATMAADPVRTEPPPTPTRPPPSRTAPPPSLVPTPAVVVPRTSPPLRRVSSSRVMWLLALLLVVATAVLLRAAAVLLARRRERRRLRRGTPVEAVCGAWEWARRSLDDLGMPVLRGLPPDVVASSGPGPGTPTAADQALRHLAVIVTGAAFAPDPPPAVTADRAWQLADTATAAARHAARRRRRLALLLGWRPRPRRNPATGSRLSRRRAAPT